MGHALLLDVPEDVFGSLVKTAEQTGQQPEALALQWLAQASQPASDDPLESFIGAFTSHGSDWIERHDEHLGQSDAAMVPQTDNNG